MYSAFCGTKEFSKTVLIKSQNNFLVMLFFSTSSDYPKNFFVNDLFLF